jgi:D-alanyl-D-alanine carboxypeptidase (penicillin-binding protein 5/6)
MCFCFISINNKFIFAADNFSVDQNIRAAVLMEASSGKILFEKDSHEKLEPASITKIMTILLIYDALKEEKIKLDDVVTVSEHAADMGGSQIFLEPYEQQTLLDLLKSVIIASANDASVAISEYICGSEEEFVKLMNERAKSLGMKDTNFMNACGLDEDGHITSAYDVALMSRELITKYPQVSKIATTWMDSIIHKTRRGDSEFGLSNTNKLIRTYNGITGLKTGTTEKALCCLCATANKNNMNLISVIMGAPTSKLRFSEAAKLLDYGFMNYSIIHGDEVGTIKGKTKVHKGQKDEVNLSVKKQAHILVSKKNKSKLESQVQILNDLKAPVEKNVKAGEIVYLLDGKEVAREDLVTSEKIDKASFWQMIKKIFGKIF